MSTSFEPFTRLFQPLRVGDFEVRNRILNPSHGNRLTGDRELRYLQERARGVGLMGIHSLGANDLAYRPGRWDPRWGNDFDVVPPDPSSPEGIEYFDRAIPQMRKRADVIHDQGAKVFAQVLNLGAGKHRDDLKHASAPSVVPEPYDMAIPHEMTEEEIEKAVVAFAHGVRRAKEAGIDAAELHGAHGYLIQQFFSPKYNRRADRYGGTRENRVRFTLEIIDASRRLVGDRYPIGIRVGVDSDGSDADGLGPEELAEVCRLLAPHVAFVNVSGGTYTGFTDHGLGQAYLAPWYQEPGPNVGSASLVKKAIGDVPVFVTHRITDPAMAERILEDGAADMVGMVRALIADPDLPRKAKDGRLDEIRPCLGLNECHYAGNERHIMCAVNPAAGREAEMEIVPATQRRTVLVVGGGPAGSEAARIAGLRGHRVILLEKETVLGGTVRVLASDPGRAIFGELPRYLEGELERAGVEVRTGCEATVDMVLAAAPDVVLVATGGRPHIPEVPGIHDRRVLTAVDVLGGAPVGQRILVVCGLDDHLAGPTIADFLSRQGKDVEMVSEQVDFASGAENATRYMLLERLLSTGVRISQLTRLMRLKDGCATLYGTFSRSERRLEVDTVVIAAGQRAEDRLARTLRGKVNAIQLIGDCLAPRRIVHAMLDGARAGNTID